MKPDMNHPLPAYSGNEAYVFVSYSHRDQAAVYAEICLLQEMGFNVWYDEGIDAGDEWTDTLADAIAESFNCVYYVTPNSVQSEHCRREIGFAQHLGKPVTSVHLTPTTLPRGLQLSLGNRQAVVKYKLSPERYRDQLDKVLRSPASADIEAQAPASRPVAASDSRRGVLVLPFINRSSNKDADFFCEGIADEIIAALSSVNSLRVISGSAARQIDATNVNLQYLQEQLDVEYVLEGSVQAAGSRLRITARLPQTSTGEVLWADRWDGANDDIFEIQDNISLGVLEALKVELGPAQSEKVVSHPIPDVNAYEYFLRARQCIYQWTDSALKQGLDYLQRGEDIIGENTYIISARGHIYWQFHNLGLDPDPKHLEAAQTCIDRLFQIDPESPQGHRLQGLVRIMRTDSIESAIEHLKKALAGNPNDIDTLFWLSQVFGLVGRVSSGMALAERLLKLDPITPMHHGLPAVLALMDGDAARAARLFGACYASNTDNLVFGFLYGQALAMSGRMPEAVDVFGKLGDRQSEALFAQLAVLYAASIEGSRESAAAVATESFLAASGSDPQSSWIVSQCYALLGEETKAIDWIANAISLGFWNYPLLAERDPILEPVRHHERYKSLMLELRDKWIFLDA